jgi:uncharacterized protein (TIGR03503 family)
MLPTRLLWQSVSVLISVICLTVSLSAADTSSKPAVDVRVIVDISGSMKQNDPENLRVPAIQLFSQLLPPDSQSGVWTFGQYVNMLVPLAVVDSAWKDEAMRTSEQINSVGLYTNIGGAIERASYGWTEKDPDVKRSLILLTDGVVDISPDAKVNANARQELLESMLPRLQEAGVTIHTIALSGDADEELLTQLAAKTDGWYQKVLMASQLQRVFLKIFGQATERESIPLLNNTFKIDEQITEFTLLVFKSGNAKETRLKMPNGDVLEASQDSPEVSWFQAEDYDVVTVSQPMVGMWQVEAEIDPDNQVLVVSNIKVKATDIPNNLLANETINIQLSLNQDNEPITDQQFLEFIKMQLEVDSDTTSEVFDIKDDGSEPDLTASDGIYTVTFTAGAEEGVTELTTLVESPTFQRIRQTAVNVYANPLQISHELSQSLNGYHRVIISPRISVIKAELSIITGNVLMPDGTTQELVLEVQDDFVYAAELDVVPEGGEYKLTFDIDGFTQNDRVFKVQTPPYVFKSPALVKETVQSEPQEVAEEVVEMPAQGLDIDWLFWFGAAGVLNVSFLVLFFLFNLIGNKRNMALAKKLGDQLETVNG